MSIKEFKSGKCIDFKYAKGKIDIFGNTFHSHYELYLFLGGKAELINDHARLSLRPYQLVIIEPGRYHQFTVEGDADEYERCVLNVREELLPPETIKNALCGAEGIKSVSGLGLMMGIETEKKAADVVAAAMEKGVLLLTAKTKVRLLPPLNISYEELEKAVNIIKEVCKNETLA